MTIEEMKRVKEERGYSFDVLSAYSGVPRATLVRVFDGTTARPRKATLDAIERVLGGDEHQFPGKKYHFGLSENYPDYNVLFDPKLTPVFRVAEEAANYAPEDHGITAEQYLNMHTDVRTELIDGEIFVMDDPLYIHSEIAQYFYVFFRDYILDHQVSCAPVLSGTNVILGRKSGRDSVVCPDLFVVCDKKKIIKKGIKGAPDFVLEVTSPGNAQNDLIRKVVLYQHAGVREYWIIRPQKKSLIKYTFEEDFGPSILPLKGSTGVYIYDDHLQINLDEISRMISADEERPEE